MNGEYERVGGSGGYHSYDAGIEWQPTESVNLSINNSGSTSAPSLDRIRQPSIIAPGSLVIDGRTGEYVVADRISGGGIDLKAVSQNDTTARLNYNKSINEIRISATLEYLRTNTTNPIISVAYPNAFFQQVFPDRFLRDSSGRLQSVDLRPFNATSQQRTVIRPVIHISGRSDKTNVLNETDNSETTWDFGINGEWVFRDILRPSPAQISVNLLKTPFDGVQGTSRYKINVETSAARKGVNLQLSARWRSGSRVEDVSNAAGNMVIFSPFWTANAEAAVTIRRPKRRARSSTPLRVSFSIENLLNRRPGVRDSTGQTPAAFQPVFVDPVGRVLALRLRLPL